MAAADGDAGRLRLSSRKGMALLAFLAMRPGTAVGRDRLADLLWGDRVDRHARQSLRQCLVRLRSDLGAELAAAILATEQSVALAAEAIDVDALAFEALAGAGPDPRCLDFSVAPFLDRFSVGTEGFDDWAEGERVRLAALAVRTFSKLADRFEAAGEDALAIAALDRLVTIDPAHEAWHRRLLRLEERCHGPEAALARGKTLAAELKRAVDVEPEPESVALLQDIRRKAAAPQAADPSPLQIERPPAAASVAGETPASLQPRRSVTAGSARRRMLAAASAGMLLLIGIGAFVYQRPGPVRTDDSRSVRREAPPPDPWRSPSVGVQTPTLASRQNESLIPVVVLPFADHIEGDVSDPSLAEQVTDDLINTLSRAYRFRVISRNTSRLYEGKSVDPAVLAAELGVRYVVEGGVRSQGDRIRVNVELIDAGTRLAVWSDQFEHESGNRAIVADEIVMRIGRALQVGTMRIEVARSGEQPSAAHQLVDKGWVTLAKSPRTAERAREAEALFVAALQRDADNREAQIGLAAYHVEIVSEVLTATPAPHTATALQILQKVIAADPHSASAYYYLGRAQRNADDFEAALRSFGRALELNPSFTFAHAQIGLTLMFLRRPADALEHIRYAIRLSPKDDGVPFWLRFAAEAELALGRYAQTVEDLERSLQMQPNQLRAWGALAAAHSLAGNAAAARRCVARLRELSPDYTDAQLLERLGRLSRLGPNPVHTGLQMALTAAASAAQP